MLARDIMTSGVISVYRKASLGQAIDLMIKLKVSGLPVVDDEGKIVGILSEGDLLRRAELGTERKRPRWLEFILGPGRLAEDYVKTHARLVEEVMTNKVYSVDELTPLADVVAAMNGHRVKRLPVVRDGKPIGIISRADLVHALGHVLERDAETPPLDDGAIKAKIQEILAQQSWAPNTAISVQVHGGTVELRGMVTDDRQEEAIRVAVETIPGVKTVDDKMYVAEVYAGPYF